MGLHPQNPSQNPQQNVQKHPQMMMAFTLQQQENQTQLSMKQPNFPYGNQNQNQIQNQNPSQKTKTQMINSDNEDEQVVGMNDEVTNDGKRKNMSPWQRMKWTDGMVRLLIMAVYYIGDEAGSEAGPGSEKKKLSACGGGSSSSGGGGMMQKKGKWKSVSKAMIEKGFKVSPQQCEDKFNDLNKRYKRVNDILGKGTACKVVENQSLLESMDLTPKMKEEVRKLLNSKHLFFREMCAYHNSCGHGTAAAASGVSQQQAHNQQALLQQQHVACVHPSSTTSPKPDNHDEDEEEDDEDDSDSDEDGGDNEVEEEDEDHHHSIAEEGRKRKRAKTTPTTTAISHEMMQLNGEAIGVIQDGAKSAWEKKQWVMTQLVKLEEQGVKFQTQALELEKQRLKWLKFSTKKEREMEKMKIDNERNKLENERMVLLMKQKEIELLVFEQHQQPLQQHIRAANPSCLTG